MIYAVGVIVVTAVFFLSMAKSAKMADDQISLVMEQLAKEKETIGGRKTAK